MSKFVPPDTTTLQLPDGDTLTVKRRLNEGERRAMYRHTYTTTPDGMKPDPLLLDLAMLGAYLVAWTLRDDAGKPVAIAGEFAVVRAALEALDPDDFAEIKAAVDTHVEAMQTAREQEKKRRAGGSGSSLTSPSPSDSMSALTGSVA